MSELLSPLIDTHAHLDSDRFAEDRESVIARAVENGIGYMISVGCDLQSSICNVEIARRHPEVYAAVGIHPHDASSLTDDVLERMRDLIVREDKVVAVGEIGLDFYRDRSPRDDQRRAFRRQIQLAREVGRPVIVHDRDAHEEVMKILREEKAREIGGVLHCFSGDMEMARACLNLGFYISFPGTITYSKNEEIRDIVRRIPMESLLVETDCPYLSPQPFRGKRNEPAFVRHTAEKIAEIRGLSLEDVARITTLNAYNLFGIGETDRTSRIAYRIRNSLYLNLTNRCTNSCIFCAKYKDFTVKGHHLKLEKEPNYDEVMMAVRNPEQYEEVVFCGYGEPLIRLDLLKDLAKRLKKEGIRIRINTDGQANLVHGRNILPELSGLVDAVSVSLNAADSETYQHLCRSRFGADAFEEVKKFILEAKKHIPSVTATAVAIPGIDMDACRRLAEGELGVPFREREYNEVG